MTNKRLVHTLFSASSILIIFIVWQLYSVSVNNPTLMPDPIKVFQRFFEMLVDKDTYVVVFTSLGRLLLSLVFATLLGTILGLLSGIHSSVEAFLKPIVVTIRTLPVISIIIVVLIIFGNTITLYIISLLLLFPIVYQAELDGVKNIDPLLIDVLKLESDATNTNVLKLVYFPLSIPFLRTALIEAVGLGFKVLVVAEYIAQTKISIGREIYMAKINLEFTDVFAWTLILLIFVLLIEFVVEKLLSPRAE